MFADSNWFVIAYSEPFSVDTANVVVSNSGLFQRNVNVASPAAKIYVFALFASYVLNSFLGTLIVTVS